jgi:hypothetical protein
MTWDRKTAATALVRTFTTALGGVRVHELMPEIINPPCVVVGRAQQVTYSTVGMGIDEATLTITIAGGIETEDAVDAIKNTCRQALDADPTLGGGALSAVAEEERNWRNVTGAGGIQLLLVDLAVIVRM